MRFGFFFFYFKLLLCIYWNSFFRRRHAVVCMKKPVIKKTHLRALNEYKKEWFRNKREELYFEFIIRMGFCNGHGIVDNNCVFCSSKLTWGENLYLMKIDGFGKETNRSLGGQQYDPTMNKKTNQWNLMLLSKFRLLWHFWTFYEGLETSPISVFTGLHFENTRALY